MASCTFCIPCRRGRRHHCRSPAGRDSAASGPRRFEGPGSCLPLHCPTAKRKEDKARSAATNRPGRPAQRGRTGRQQGPAAAQAEPEPPTDKAARQGAGTARNDPPKAGAQSEPPSPRVKIPHRGPEQGPTGEGGRRESAPRGEGGEPPRGRAPYPADATEAVATRRARRRAKRAPPPGTRAAILSRTDARAQNYAAGASGARKPPER